MFFRVVIFPSLCHLVLLSCRRRTNTLCIVCRTWTFFHLTVQVDRRDTIPLFPITFIPGYNCLSASWSLPPLDQLLYAALVATSPPVLFFLQMFPPSCFPSPNPYHYSPSLFVFPIWPVLDSSPLSWICDIDLCWWVGYNTQLHPTLVWWLRTFALLVSHVTQNAAWTIQNQRGTQASTVKETLTRWRRRMRRRSWFPGKVWGVLRDKSVTTLPPEVKICKRRSHFVRWNPFSISNCYLSNMSETDLLYESSNPLVLLLVVVEIDILIVLIFSFRKPDRNLTN